MFINFPVKKKYSLAAGIRQFSALLLLRKNVARQMAAFTVVFSVRLFARVHRRRFFSKIKS
jgi:hypothetical protein